MTNEQWMRLLDRYLTRFYELAHSQQDIGRRRACSDGQLTMLLAEIALRLPLEERELIQEMITVHNMLWDPSLAEMVLRIYRPPGGV